MKSRFAHLDRDSLLSGIRHARSEEKRILSDLLQYLAEIDRRKSYIEWGYSNLFAFLIRELGYEKSSAYRRLLALRALRSNPEVDKKLRTGELNLSTLCQAQQVIQAEQKVRNIPADERRSIYQLVENRSQREAERALVDAYPHTSQMLKNERLNRPTERAVPGGLREIRWMIPEELADGLERLKDLRSQACFDRDPVKLLGWLVDLGLEQIDPVRRESRRQNRKVRQARPSSAAEPSVSSSVAEPEVLSSAAEPSVPSSVAEPHKPTMTQQRPINRRAISRPLRDFVYGRGGGRCEYVSPATGRKCESTHALEVDHIIPVTAGGASTKENLRLLCDSHNRARARAG